MSTTTIRLPDDLKARVARAAKRSDTTAHRFILDAIAEKTDSQDRLADFHTTAEQRYAAFVASGETVPWSRMRGYLEERLVGKNVKHPAPKKLR